MPRKPYEKKVRTKPKENIYEGILNQPIILKGSHSRFEDLPEFGNRVIALFEHYNIMPHEDGAGMKLALALASEHVKGFQIINQSDVKKVGAEAKWKNTGEGLELFIKVRRENLLEDKSERSSILSICNQDGQNSTYARYKEVKRTLTQDVKDKLDEILRFKNDNFYKLLLSMTNTKLKNGSFALKDEAVLSALIDISKDLQKNSGT